MRLQGKQMFGVPRCVGCRQPLGALAWVRRASSVYGRIFRWLFTRWQGAPQGVYRPLAWLYNTSGYADLCLRCSRRARQRHVNLPRDVDRGLYDYGE